MKHLVFLIATICTLTGSVPNDTPKQIAQRFTVQASFTYDCLVSLPERFDDDSEANTRWPLIVFLHGLGERGADLNIVKKAGLPKLIEQGLRLPFVVVSPQCPDDEWWNLAALEPFIDEIVRCYRVDPDRVYLTGLSMGGFGVWALAARHPERYAAIIPICGGAELKWASRLRNVPIWAFHGALDNVVPVSRSQEIVNAVTAAGGNPRLTIYPDGKHNIWTETYANNEIYSWLLSHRRHKLIH